MRSVLVLLLLSLCLPASARMYQWVNQNTGRVELSGSPPTWYRAAHGGPRIQVFDQGQMVDDTAIRLSSSQSEKLRNAAFEEFEVRRQAEQIKRLERVARREAVFRQRAEFADSEDEAKDQTAEGQAPSSGESPNELPDLLDEDMIGRLKGLIQIWDKQSSGAQ